MNQFLNGFTILGFFAGVVIGPLILMMVYPIQSSDRRVTIKMIVYTILGLGVGFIAGLPVGVALALGLYTGHYFFVYTGTKQHTASADSAFWSALTVVIGVVFGSNI